jgi:multiple sugar transport system ATP-binding protein
MNFVKAEIAAADGAGAKVRAAGSDIAMPRPAGAPGDKVTFGVRPEHIGIDASAGVKLADVRVELVEQLGGQTMVYATTADGHALTIAVDGQRQIAPGAQIEAFVDPARYHLFGADGKAL